MIKNTKYINGILVKINNFYSDLEEQKKQNNEKIQKAKKNQKTTSSDKQLYLQNLEKKINEISSYSMESKEKRGNTISKIQIKSDGLKASEAGQPSTDKKIKKFKLCHQFIATGFCRGGSECMMAHKISDLDTEYIPKGDFLLNKGLTDICIYIYIFLIFSKNIYFSLFSLKSKKIKT